MHIKIHPRPRNLGESRQILRILERFGEVVMYKNLRVGVLSIPRPIRVRRIATDSVVADLVRTNIV